MESMNGMTNLLICLLSSMYPSKLFELVEENPIAAASIGQVYKAKLRSTGEYVAVKVGRGGR